MLTEETIRVEVTHRDITRANPDYCPITLALSRTLNESPDNIQVQNKLAWVFDDHDQKKEIYSYDDDSIVISFLDNWERYMCGLNEHFDPIQFSLIRRQ
jgi:hypothetical protein